MQEPFREPLIRAGAVVFFLAVTFVHSSSVAVMEVLPASTDGTASTYAGVLMYVLKRRTRHLNYKLIPLLFCGQWCREKDFRASVCKCDTWMQRA